MESSIDRYLREQRERRERIAAARRNPLPRQRATEEFAMEAVRRQQREGPWGNFRPRVPDSVFVSADRIDWSTGSPICLDLDPGVSFRFLYEGGTYMYHVCTPEIAAATRSRMAYSHYGDQAPVRIDILDEDWQRSARDRLIRDSRGTPRQFEPEASREDRGTSPGSISNLQSPPRPEHHDQGEGDPPANRGPAARSAPSRTSRTSQRGALPSLGLSAQQREDRRHLTNRPGAPNRSGNSSQGNSGQRSGKRGGRGGRRQGRQNNYQNDDGPRIGDAFEYRGTMGNYATFRPIPHPGRGC
jgi:hypothetical protein